MFDGHAVVCAAEYNALAGTKGTNHMHYIRAEPVQWDFAPGGLVDMCTGEHLGPDRSVSLRKTWVQLLS